MEKKNLVSDVVYTCEYKGGRWSWRSDKRSRIIMSIR